MPGTEHLQFPKITGVLYSININKIQPEGSDVIPEIFMIPDFLINKDNPRMKNVLTILKLNI